MFQFNEVNCNLTKLINNCNNCAVSCLSGQRFLHVALARLRILLSQILQRGVLALISWRYLSDVLGVLPPPSLPLVFLSSDPVSVMSAWLWGFMAALWGLPAMVALVHLGGGQLPTVEAPQMSQAPIHHILEAVG